MVGQRGSQAQPSSVTPGLMMPRVQVASMETRQAEAALADGGADPRHEYLMWRAARRQERTDKHTMNTQASRSAAAYTQELADIKSAAAAAAAPRR